MPLPGIAALGPVGFCKGQTHDTPERRAGIAAHGTLTDGPAPDSPDIQSRCQFVPYIVPPAAAMRRNASGGRNRLLP